MKSIEWRASDEERSPKCDEESNGRTNQKLKAELDSKLLHGRWVQDAYEFEFQRLQMLVQHCWTTHQIGWRLLITFVSLAERILALWLEAGASLSIRIRSLGFSFVRISIRLESIHLDLHSFGFRIDQNERLFFEEIASLSNFLINSWESNLQFVCKWKQLHHEILFWSILSFLIPLLIKWTHRHFEIETCINHIENFGKFGYTQSLQQYSTELLGCWVWTLTRRRTPADGRPKFGNPNFSDCKPWI